MNRKTLIGLMITVLIVAAAAIIGWGYSTNWTFKKAA